MIHMPQQDGSLKEVPDVILLGTEVCGTPNNVAVGGQFEPAGEASSVNLLPEVIIHEFAHLLHFWADEIDPEALLKFSRPPMAYARSCASYARRSSRRPARK